LPRSPNSIPIPPARIRPRKSGSPSLCLVPRAPGQRVIARGCRRAARIAPLLICRLGRDTTFCNGIRRSRAALNDPHFIEYVTRAKDVDHQTLAVRVWRSDPHMARHDGIHSIRRVALHEEPSAITRHEHSATCLDPVEFSRSHTVEGFDIKATPSCLEPEPIAARPHGDY